MAHDLFFEVPALPMISKYGVSCLQGQDSPGLRIAISPIKIECEGIEVITGEISCANPGFPNPKGSSVSTSRIITRS